MGRLYTGVSGWGDVRRLYTGVPGWGDVGDCIQVYLGGVMWETVYRCTWVE